MHAKGIGGEADLRPENVTISVFSLANALLNLRLTLRFAGFLNLQPVDLTRLAWQGCTYKTLDCHPFRPIFCANFAVPLSLYSGQDGYAVMVTLSLDVTDCSGGRADVPDDDIARLMYYLRCVTKGVGLDFLQDDLIRYKNYESLSLTQIALVFKTAVELSPDVFIDKLIFRDEDNEVLGKSSNKFVRISAAYHIASLQSDILLMGKVRKATQVMFFRSSWLDKYYSKPIQRIASIILGTKHCAHCEGGDGLCSCSTCPRTAESKCTDIVDVLLGVFNAAIPSRSARPPPRPVTTQPQPVEPLRPEQHQCTCDGCGLRSFTGVRYRCSSCHDYDLCGICYKNNIHDTGHRFNQHITPGARPVLLTARARSAPPPLPSRTQADTTPNHPPPLYSSISRTSTSSSPFFYNTMSTSELKSFLKDRGVAFDDILDKETLCRRAWDTHCDSMGMVELNAFLSENSISTADCRDVASRRQKAKSAFIPPTRPVPPPASTNTSGVRWRKDDDVVLTGLTRAEMNGKRGTVVSVDHATGRVQVRVPEMDKLFKVKFENLQMTAVEEEDEELD